MTRGAKTKVQGSQTKLKFKRIALLSSGGDSPGMNACIRAIVRSANFRSWEVYGVRRGYQGLVEGDFHLLSLRSVGNIIQRGGTILGSSRSAEFRSRQGRALAFRELHSLQISDLIVLGGDGTLAGAAALSREYPIRVIGIPCTIDNDIPETDLALGFDTAVETAVECVDKIRDTADSHGRVFVVEVMGKQSGHLALETSLAVGAEFAIIPEKPFKFDRLVEKIQRGIERGKKGSIVIVAEGKKPGLGVSIAQRLRAKLDVEVRDLTLGHLQRGGSPSRLDRNLASRFGDFAVELIDQHQNRVMTAWQKAQLVAVRFERVAGRRKSAQLSDLRLIDRLSI
jgi:6-phosphofructokinase 1